MELAVRAVAAVAGCEQPEGWQTLPSLPLPPGPSHPGQDCVPCWWAWGLSGRAEPSGAAGVRTDGSGGGEGSALQPGPLLLPWTQTCGCRRGWGAQARAGPAWPAGQLGPGRRHLASHVAAGRGGDGAGAVQELADPEQVRVEEAAGRTGGLGRLLWPEELCPVGRGPGLGHVCPPTPRQVDQPPPPSHLRPHKGPRSWARAEGGGGRGLRSALYQVPVSGGALTEMRGGWALAPDQVSVNLGDLSGGPRA